LLFRPPTNTPAAKKSLSRSSPQVPSLADAYLEMVNLTA
jgi:hypothetical protein